MKMQEKIMAEIEATFKKEKLDFVVQYAYSNTGTIFAQVPKTFETVWQIAFSFQNENVTLGNWSIGENGKDWISADYGNTDEMNKLFSFIRECLGHL